MTPSPTGAAPGDQLPPVIGVGLGGGVENKEPHFLAEEHRALFVHVVDHSSDAIYTKCIDETVISWNLGAQHIYGYTAAEIIGQPVFAIVPQDKREELRDVTDRVRRGEVLNDFETERTCKDGRRIHVSLSISPLRDTHGKIVGASTIARDITERVRAQAALQQMNETLEQRVLERTENLIRYQGRLRALVTELMLTEQRERRRLAIELHDYLAQLLVASRMKLGQLAKTADAENESPLQEVDDILRDCINYTRTLIAELSPAVLYESGILPAIKWLSDQMCQHGLEVSVVSEGKPCRAREDQELLVYQSIRELLVNAAKHSQVHEAQVHLWWHPEKLVVRVFDQGVGFDVNEQRLLSETRKKFGLFNVKERIEATGGEFAVSSRPGAGAEVSFTLPLHPRIEEEDAQATQVQDLPQRTAIRVLLADDHELVRQGLRRIINSSGDLEVVGEAGNGEEAWEWALRLNPDVVLMDVNMPRMNGIEATRHIRRELPETAVVGLSLHDDPQLATAMINAGAHSYITKGGPPEELCQALRVAVAKDVPPPKA
ncbi:MAG: response regulator [Candidatus Hydrogenedentes bacterium]|nr:response regulator [Candidatus Hydrogenedentota bacterium]